MSTDAARAAHELRMMESLVDCAFGLATSFAAAAKSEQDPRLSLDLMEGFTKCAFAVRMGIRLCMAFKAPSQAPPAHRPDLPPERESRDAEALERLDARERLEPLERERDRDFEAVSLPRFLRTLGVVSKDARRLGERLPAAAAEALPALDQLLAQAGPTAGAGRRVTPAPAVGGARPVAGLAVLARPAPAPPTRQRLMGSAAPPRPPP